MDVGKYFDSNQKRFESISEDDWKVALYKSKKHLQIRLKQRTLYGAHSRDKLCVDPLEYYISYAYEALLAGEWEWKDEFTLSEQMIRIIDSRISTNVKKEKTKKAEKAKTIFGDVDLDFNNLARPPNGSVVDEDKFIRQVLTVEYAIKGDCELEVYWGCVKEGMKRKDIAELFEITPKKLDKLKERFIRTVRSCRLTVKT